MNALEASERDELTYAALERLPPFERRIIGLAYGLPSIGGGGESMHLTEVATSLRSNVERIQRRHTEAIGKLAAVIGVADEPQRVTYQLFRMATREQLVRRRFEEYRAAMTAMTAVNDNEIPSEESER